MTKERIESFPMMPVKHWWALRKKFKQSIPGTVTDNYLATTLDMTIASARANVLPYLKSFGLTDEEGKTGDLAKKWRDDKQYPTVCKSMLEKIYPTDLISAVPNPSEDRDAVDRWFANHTGAGDAAVKRMATIYTVIFEADVSKAPEVKSVSGKKTKTAKKTVTKKKKSAVDAVTSSEEHVKDPLLPISAPGVSINLEIHVSSDATPDQIDQIFESMARHIYKK